MSRKHCAEGNMNEITEKEEFSNQEELDAELFNAPLGFLPFDLEAHYNSQPTTPESERSGHEHLPGYSKPPVHTHKLFALQRKLSDGDRDKRKEMRKVAGKLDKLREKQRKVEQKAAQAECQYNSLVEKEQKDKTSAQEENEATFQGAKQFLHRLYHAIF